MTLISLGLLGSAGPAAAVRSRTGLPPVITGSGPGLYPEGTVWDPTRHAFLVSSARLGTVSVVRPDGTTTVLVDDPALVSTFGLTIDVRRGRILITYADLGVGARTSPQTQHRLSGLAIADLATGAVLKTVDLGTDPGPHAANDVAVDPSGTAYVTDTAGAAIFRVDRRGVVLGAIRDPRFVTSSPFGVNGIAWNPHGYLLSARYDTGAMFRISPDGARVEPVSVPTSLSLVGADGIRFQPDGSLVVVTNDLGGAGTNAVHVLRPDPGSNWLRAHESRVSPAWADPAPTAVTVTPCGEYVLSGRLDRLLTGDATVNTFSLRRV
jgi:sugar lactone lactonase YvrE